jgi:hypothetical protein
MIDAENIRQRLDSLERQNDVMFDQLGDMQQDIRRVGESVKELLDVFNGTKSVIGFVRAVGRFTIAFGLFGGTIAALYLWGKVILLAILRGKVP